MKICGVYLIISPSGRRYVGSSIDIDYRWSLYRRLNCRRQKLLYNSLKKYTPAKHTFSILFRCNETDMFGWERIFGDLCLSFQEYGGLNLSLPKSGDRPYDVSKETRTRLSENAKKCYEDNPESILRFKEGAKRFRVDNPDKIKVFQERATEAKRTPEYRAKRSAIAKEMGRRPEVRKERSDRIKKRFENPEERKAQSDRTRRHMSVPGNHPASKKVINTETGEIFLSVKHLSNITGHNYKRLRNRLSGDVKNDTPYRYLEDKKQKVNASDISK